MDDETAPPPRGSVYVEDVVVRATGGAPLFVVGVHRYLLPGDTLTIPGLPYAS